MTPPDAPAPDDQPGVLSGLSRTRPQRRSTKRPGPPEAGEVAAPGRRSAAKAQAKPAPAGKAKATPKAAAKTKTAPRTKPKAAAAAPRKAATATTASPPPKPAKRVEPVMARPEPAPGAAPEPPTPPPSQVSGTELVAQAIQAAGEVAQLGIGIGRQVAKGVLSRLPRP